MMNKPTLKEAYDIAKRIMPETSEVTATRIIKEALEEVYGNGYSDAFAVENKTIVINGVKYTRDA